MDLVFPRVILFFFLRPLLRLFIQQNTTGQVGNFFVIFILIFFVALPALGVLRKVLSTKGYGCIIRVDRQGIRVVYPRQRNKELAISAQDIISLDYSTKTSQLELAASQAAAAGIGYRGMNLIAKYARGKGVVVKSRKGMFYLVPGQSDEETQYLYRLISHYLAEPAKSD